VETASTIGVSYDPMLAKVISWAPSRDEASAILASALRRARIDGVVTNRDLLVRVLDSPEWLAGDTDTGFFDRLGRAGLGEPLVSVDDARDYPLAAALGQAALRRREAPVLANLPSGWRSNPSQPQHVAYTTAGREESVEVAYALGRAGLVASVNGEPLECAVIAADPAAGDRVAVVLESALIRRSFEVHVVSAQTPMAAGPVARIHISGPEGSVTLHEVPRFPEPSAQVEPGSLTASMPGSVVRVLVSDGDVVAAGQPVVVLEAMKMEHTVTAPAAGTVTTVAVEVGAQVETGSLLVVVGSSAG
jgi:propionyl-CoA carboxylase alpha chain